MTNDELEAQLAPAVRSIADGNLAEALPMMSGVIATLVGGPIAGAAGASAMSLAQRLLTANRTQAFLAEGRRIEDEREKQRALSSYLVEMLAPLRSGDSQRFEELTAHSDVLAEQHFVASMRVSAGISEKLDSLLASQVGQADERAFDACARGLEELLKMLSDLGAEQDGPEGKRLQAQVNLEGRRLYDLASELNRHYGAQSDIVNSVYQNLSGVINNLEGRLSPRERLTGSRL